MQFEKCFEICASFAITLTSNKWGSKVAVLYPPPIKRRPVPYESPLLGPFSLSSSSHQKHKDLSYVLKTVM